MLDGRHFKIFEIISLLYSHSRKTPEKASPRQSRHLLFTSKFTTDIQHNSGKENIVAYALSRIKAGEITLDYETQRYKPKYCFKKIKLPRTGTELYWDVSTTLTSQNHSDMQPFTVIHNQSHPGGRGRAKQVSRSFVWPLIKKDWQTWVKTCIPCQRSKILSHIDR